MEVDGNEWLLKSRNSYWNEFTKVDRICFASPEKMIRAKVKTMFDERNVDPAIQDSFVASSGWIEKLMKSITFYAGKYPSCCSYTWQAMVLQIPVVFLEGFWCYCSNHVSSVCFFTTIKKFARSTHFLSKNMRGIKKFWFDFGHNLFSLYFCRRRTITAQKDPIHMTGKVVSLKK